MKIEWLDKTHVTFVDGESRTGVTIYKPSEWLYFLTGFLPEKLHIIFDWMRWKLEAVRL
jgi:hypothetical protein